MTPERAPVERAQAVVDEYRRRLGDSKPLDWDDPKALNHGVKVVVECIAEALAEYARKQVRFRAEYWTGEIQRFCDLANSSEAKLTAARQREEEAKEDARQGWAAAHVADGTAAEAILERDALHAENARLTLAASESARTLQVRLEHLQNELEHSDAFRVDLLEACKKQRIRAQNAEAQVTALREAMRQGTAAIHADHDQALIPCPIVICQFFRAALPQDGA